MPQIDVQQFWLEIGGIIGVVLLFLLYLLTRYLTAGKLFFIGSQLDEMKLLEKGEVKLKDLQEGAWQFNASKVVAFSSFSLGTLILATVFIFE